MKHTLLSISLLFMFFSNYTFALENSDLTFTIKDLKHSSKDNEFEADLELSLEPKENNITDYSFGFEVDYDKSVDAYDKTTVEETEISLEWQYEHKKLFPYVSYTNSFEYVRKKEAHRYEKEDDYKIGLIGIKQHLYDDDIISEFSLEYMPLFHSSSYDKPNYIDDTYNQMTERSLKQRLKLTLDFSLMESKLEIGNEIQWEKISKLDTELESGEETDFNWDFTVDYQISKRVSIGVEYIIDKDSQRKAQDMDETERTTNFTFSVHL